MKKDKDFPEILTVLENSISSSDNGESLNVYMKLLQKLPLLKKEEEVSLARQIKTSKATILALCVKVPECITEIFLLKELSLTEQRKLFFAMLSEDEESEKSEVPELIKKLEELLSNCLKKKKNSDKDLIEFLVLMSFTLNDLQKLSKPILEHGTPTQIKDLNTHLGLFKISKNKMIECNLRLVFARAKLYMNKGLSLEDLLQEGNLGLIKAIEKYDVEKGYKFGTYATWWIDQALGRSVADKGRLIRVPVHMVENINRLTRATRVLTQKLGRDPSVEELSKATTIPEDKIKKVKKIVSFPHSVEEPQGDIGIPLSDYLVDTESSDPFQTYERKEIAQQVRFLLSKLSPREEKILRMRFGIGEKKTSILSQIGNQFSVSGERVRQIIVSSISKMNHFTREESFENDWTEFKGRFESKSDRSK